jgi:hypothetical protein
MQFTLCKLIHTAMPLQEIILQEIILQEIILQEKIIIARKNIGLL